MTDGPGGISGGGPAREGDPVPGAPAAQGGGGADRLIPAAAPPATRDAGEGRPAAASGAAVAPFRAAPRDAEPRRATPRRIAARPWCWRIALLTLALLGALGGGFVWFVNQTLRPPEPAPLRPTDAIAVLTGGRERVETGLRLLAAGHARRLLITGVHRDATLADLARGAGLDPAPLAARVTVGRAAATTRGNAAEIAAWVRAQPEDAPVRSIRVVTAGYHMPRALLELRRALPGLELVSHPVTPPALRGVGAAARLRTWSLLAGEYAKFLLAGAGLSRFTVASHREATTAAAAPRGTTVGSREGRQ